MLVAGLPRHATRWLSVVYGDGWMRTKAGNRAYGPGCSGALAREEGQEYMVFLLSRPEGPETMELEAPLFLGRLGQDIVTDAIRWVSYEALTRPLR